MPTQSHEDDESFEYDHEAFEPTAGARARARVRADAFAQQRVVAQQARASQRQLDSRIASITQPLRGPGSSVRLRRLQPVHGSAVVTVTLPNGRRTQMSLSPAPATASSVNQLRSQVAANDERHAKALRTSGQAIDRLGAAQAAAVKKLTEQGVKSDKELTKRSVDGDAKLDKRFAADLAKLKSRNDGSNRTATKALARAQRRALWNNVLLASGLPFFAAFGDGHSPFARNNLLLTGSLAGWMLGDEVIDRLAGGARAAKPRKGRKNPGAQAWRRGVDLWSYLAPVGNAATAWFMLKDQQHARFLTGVTTVTHGSGVISGNRIELDVAERYRDQLEKVTGARAVAAIVSPRPADVIGVRAVVEGDELVLTPIFRTAAATTGSVTIAWVVDTRDPNA
jgi:hypothetical protein